MTTATKSDVGLIKHLLRRASFGATPAELDHYEALGYEAAIEELLHPGDPQNMPDDIIKRYHTDMHELRYGNSATAYWLYRMVTTKAPMEEKIALFWHGVFATGYAKTNQARSLLNQIDMFRRLGLGKLDDLLIDLAKDPSMIIWLDNQENHDGAINENWGRELLELFSMGIGNYTEDDIKEASRRVHGLDAGQRGVHGGARVQGTPFGLTAESRGISTSAMGTTTTARSTSSVRRATSTATT